MAATRATMVKPSGSILEELEARKDPTRKSRNTVVVRSDTNNSTNGAASNSQSTEHVNGRKPRNTIVAKEQRAIIPQNIEYPNGNSKTGSEAPTGYAIKQHRPTLVPRKSSEAREVQCTQSEASAVASPNAKVRQLRIGTDEGISELTSVGLKPSPPRIAQSSASKAAADTREKKGFVASLEKAIQDAKEEDVVFPISQYIDSVIQSALQKVATKNMTV